MHTRFATLKGVAYLLLTTFLYSLEAIFIRILGFSIPFAYQSMVLAGIGATLLFFLMKSQKVWKKPAKRDFIWILIRGVAGVLAYITFYVSMYFLQIGMVYFLFYGSLIISSFLLGRFIYRETIEKVEIIAVFLAMIGLLLTYAETAKTTSISWTFIFITIAAGFFDAVWMTSAKRVTHVYAETQLNFLDFFISTICWFVISIILREQWVAPQINVAWGSIAFIAVVFVVTGQTIIKGFKLLDAQFGSLIMLSEILFGIVVGYIGYQEKITVLVGIGGLLIVAAMALPQIRWEALRKQYTKKGA